MAGRNIPSMKIEKYVREKRPKAPDGTRKDGIRLDSLLDVLTTIQASGAPDGSSVLLTSWGEENNRTVEVHWTEEVS